MTAVVAAYNSSERGGFNTNHVVAETAIRQSVSARIARTTRLEYRVLRWYFILFGCNLLIGPAG